MTETQANHSHCPTPRKVRYLTRGAARNAANVRSRSVGFPLYTYRCGCGSFHLTKRRQEEITNIPEVQVHGLGHILGMDENSFANVVIADVTGQLDPSDGEFLRHAQVIARWRDALVSLRKRVELQLSSLSKLRNPSPEDDEWRALLVEMVASVELRQGECGALARGGPAEQGEKKVVRRTAGDRAVSILVNRHLAEFTEIYYAEARRAGLDLAGVYLPDGELSADDLRKAREVSPAHIDVDTHEPRFPDAHLILIGDESFDDAAALVIGVIYRHLREEVESPLTAGRALRDMALQVERCSGRTLHELVQLARDWITVHV